MVHGDDFVSVGSRDATKRFQDQLAASFEIKTQVIGAGHSVQHACDCTEGNMLKATGEPDLSVQRARLCTVKEGDPIEIQEGRCSTASFDGLMTGGKVNSTSATLTL